MRELGSGFAEQIKKYLDWRGALGYSCGTDGSMLAMFDKYCVEHHPDSAELSRQIVRGWINHKNTSIQNKSTAIRNFAKYLQAQNCAAYELPAYGQLGKKEKFLPHMFTDSELRALFAAVGKIKPSLTHPHLPVILPALFRLIYSCGLRPNEGRELLRENIDFASGAILIVNAKGKKERTVVMSDDMRKFCVDYDEQREKFAGVNPYFFPSDNGGVYTSKVIQQWFRDCWAAANPEAPESSLPRVRVYDLRHVFATTALTRWVESGANLQAKLAYLQAYMGHETIDETLYYVHLLPETLLSDGNWETLPEGVS